MITPLTGCRGFRERACKANLTDHGRVAIVTTLAFFTA